MSNILLAPSEKVVDAQHVVAGLDESVAEVRAKKASAPPVTKIRLLGTAVLVNFGFVCCGLLMDGFLVEFQQG